MKKTIEIDGQKYNINLEKAVADGYLTKAKRYPTQGDKVSITSRYYVTTIVIVARISSGTFKLIGLNDGNRFSDDTLVKNLSVEEWDSYMERLKIIDWKVIED